MQKITMVVVAVLISAQSVFANDLTTLARCENIADKDIGSIIVSYIQDSPGILLVSVGYQDGSRSDLSVGVQEWKQKSFTLPSTRSSSYRLFLWEKKWVLFQDDTSHVNQKHIDCQTL